MSEIPPRFDKVDLNDKIIRVNHFIKKETQKQNGWHMLCHNLLEADYKKDKLHFNDRGIAKYAHQIRHIIRTVKSE